MHLLQGSIESDDSPASGGDEEEGDQGQVDNRAIKFDAGRSRSGRPTTRHVLRQSTMVIKPGKAINGLDTEKLLNCKTCLASFNFSTSCKAGILLLVIDRDPYCNTHRVKEEIHIRLQHQQG